MAIAYANLVSSSDKFRDWVNKTNIILRSLTTEVVTANSGVAITGNTLAIRNAQLFGTYVANTFVSTNNLRGGNVVSTGLLTITSNSEITGQSITVTANLYVNNATSNINSQELSLNTPGIVSVIGNTQFNNTVTFNSNVTIANTVHLKNLCNIVTYSNNNLGTTVGSELITFTYSATGFRAAKVSAQIKNFGNTAVQASEFVVTSNGTAAFMTNYATVASPVSTDLGDFSVDVNASNVRIKFNQTSANCSMRLYSKLLTI